MQNDPVVYTVDLRNSSGRVQEEICGDDEVIEEYVTYRPDEYAQHIVQVEINHETSCFSNEVPVLANPRPPKKGRPKYLPTQVLIFKFTLNFAIN